MRTFILVLFLILAFSVSHAKPDKQQERAIKLSGDFYYGDGNGNTEKEAKQIADDNLKLMIIETLKMQNSNIEVVGFKDFENNIGSISIPIEDQYRVISFFSKKDIKIETAGVTELVVILMKSDDSSDILVNKREKKQKNKEKKVSKKEEQTKIEEQPQIVIEPQVIPETKNESLNTGIEIIDVLLKINNRRDFIKVFDEKGEWRYGRVKNLKQPDIVYFVIFDGDKLVDILDKGTTKLRKGFLSGKEVDYTGFSENEIIWILDK